MTAAHPIVHRAIVDRDTGEAFAHIRPMPWRPWSDHLLDIVQRHRAARGWSVNQLAAVMHRHPNGVRSVLRGGTILTFRTAEELLNALGLQLDPPSVTPVR